MGGTVLFGAVPQVRGTAFYTVGPGSSGRAFHQGVRVRADHYHSVGPGGSAVWCRGVGVENMNDNKDMERVKILSALRCCGNTDTKRPDCERCPLNGYMCVKRMLEGAAALLERDAEPPNDPLTLTELHGMDGEPVYIHGSDRCGYYIATDVEIGLDLYRGGCGYEGYKDYGKTWLAYRRKPDGGGE